AWVHSGSRVPGEIEQDRVDDVAMDRMTVGGPDVHAVIDDSWIAATEHLQPALQHTSRPHTPLSPPPPFGHDTGEGRAQTKDDLGGRVTHPVRPGFVSQTE